MTLQKRDTTEETFNHDQVTAALESWLEFGEQMFNPNHKVGDKYGQAGYFSGGGFAARCLRWHLEQLKKEGRV